MLVRISSLDVKVFTHLGQDSQSYPKYYESQVLFLNNRGQ